MTGYIDLRKAVSYEAAFVLYQIMFQNNLKTIGIFLTLLSTKASVCDKIQNCHYYF